MSLESFIKESLDNYLTEELEACFDDILTSYIDEYFEKFLYSLLNYIASVYSIDRKISADIIRTRLEAFKTEHKSTFTSEDMFLNIESLLEDIDLKKRYKEKISTSEFFPLRNKTRYIAQLSFPDEPGCYWDIDLQDQVYGYFSNQKKHSKVKNDFTEKTLKRPDDFYMINDKEALDLTTTLAMHNYDLRRSVQDKESAYKVAKELIDFFGAGASFYSNVTNLRNPFNPDSDYVSEYDSSGDVTIFRYAGLITVNSDYLAFVQRRWDISCE